MRFLVLPGFRIPNLASRVLGLSAQHLSSDMEALLGHLVLLAETFVDPALFAGTYYLPCCWLDGDWGDAGRGALAGTRAAGGGSGGDGATRMT